MGTIIQLKNHHGLPIADLLSATLLPSLTPYLSCRSFFSLTLMFHQSLLQFQFFTLVLLVVSIIAGGCVMHRSLISISLRKVFNNLKFEKETNKHISCTRLMQLWFNALMIMNYNSDGGLCICWLCVLFSVFATTTTTKNCSHVLIIYSLHCITSTYFIFIRGFICIISPSTHFRLCLFFSFYFFIHHFRLQPCPLHGCYAVRTNSPATTCSRQQQQQ